MTADWRSNGIEQPSSPTFVHVDGAAAERFRVALEMYEIGEQMQRQRLRLTHPEADEIEAALRDWRLDKPLDSPRTEGWSVHSLTEPDER